MPATHLALLRGINVGGKNKLPMKDLREMFVEAGCENVQTYIQSGNVIFRASDSVSARVPARITAQVAKRFGYNAPVMLRTAAQLRAVISSNPFLEAGGPEETQYVSSFSHAHSRNWMLMMAWITARRFALRVVW